jgi:hypothetical protein
MISLSGKPLEEQRVEQITVGAVLLAVAPALLSQWFPHRLEGLSAVAVGLVLLGSGFYQRGRGWPVGRITWIAGIAAIALGLASVASGGQLHSATALVVVLLGLWFVGRGIGHEV